MGYLVPHPCWNASRLANDVDVSDVRLSQISLCHLHLPPDTAAHLVRAPSVVEPAFDG